MVMKKRQLLVATLVVALGAAVAVNWYYSKVPVNDGSETTIEQSVSGNLGDSLLVAGTTAKSESSETSKETETTIAPDENQQQYFADAKQKRTTAHDEVIDNIEDILENENLTESEKNKIAVILSDFQADVKAETDAENLISAKTGKDCLVAINNSKAQVILEKNTLNDTVLLQITEIIEKNTNITSQNLTIVEAK